MIENPKAAVAIVMGSKSDLETMQPAADVLAEFGIPFELRVVSAHRTPKLMYDFAEASDQSEIQVIIAGAGGAAHLPGMLASLVCVPVIGVPVQSKALRGLDSLLSIVQMPASTPVATMAIGQAGAKNAAWLAMKIISLQNVELKAKLHAAKEKLAQEIGAIKL